MHNELLTETQTRIVYAIIIAAILIVAAFDDPRTYHESNYAHERSN